MRFKFADMKIKSHLLLSEDQHSLWFDGMVRCQVFSAAPHHSILKGFPHPVTGGPRDAQVMPFPIIDEERQLCNLRQRHCRKGITSFPLFHTSSPPLPAESHIVLLYNNASGTIFMPFLSALRSCLVTLNHHKAQTTETFFLNINMHVNAKNV